MSLADYEDPLRLLVLQEELSALGEDSSLPNLLEARQAGAGEITKEAGSSQGTGNAIRRIAWCLREGSPVRLWHNRFAGV